MKPQQELQAPPPGNGPVAVCGTWLASPDGMWSENLPYADVLSGCQVWDRLRAFTPLDWAGGSSTPIKSQTISCRLLGHAVSFHGHQNQPESGSITLRDNLCMGQPLHERFVASLACSNLVRQPFLDSALSFPTPYKQDSSLFTPGRPFRRR